MEDHNQHIDQYFRQQLGGYTEQPAVDVWAALEQRLDEKPRKRLIPWIWFILLFMASIGGTAYYKHLAGIETIDSPNPPKPIHIDLSATPRPATIQTTVSKPIQEPKPSVRRSASNRPSRSKLPAAIPVVTNHSVASAVPEPAVYPTTPETNALKAELVSAPGPSPTELKKPEPAQDILHLLPTAGKGDQYEKQFDEEVFQALVPSSGAKMETSTGLLAESTPDNQPSQTLRPVDNSPAEITQMQPAETEKTALTNIPADTQIAEKDRIRRFSAGLKTGYEFGTKPYHANSFVLSPYLQYNLGKRFGLLLQPAFKYSHSEAALLSKGSYSRTTDSLKEVVFVGTPNGGSGIPASNDEHMAYRKTYDSIFITNELKDVRYWNLDLPLMLSYKVYKNFSVYAGPAFHFTRVPKVATTKQTHSGLVLVDTLKMNRKHNSAEFDTLNINEVFPQAGPDISAHNTSAFDNPTINPFKMGVTFGLSYTFRQRFHFDILYRQTLSKMEYIFNDKVREILRQPYIRVTLGFDLLK